MHPDKKRQPYAPRRPRNLAFALAMSVGLLLAASAKAQAPGATEPSAQAGSNAAQNRSIEEAELLAEAAMDHPSDNPQSPAVAAASGNLEGSGAADTTEAAEEVEAPKINLLELVLMAKWLMLPIAVMSLLVVAFGAERFFGLRRGKVLPSALIRGLNAAVRDPAGFDPRQAFQLCQRYPSAAARVIRIMLLRVGRPHGEVQHAISEANDREAARLYSNVRWLSLAAGISPLLGLLGTVWGMIEAFFATANLPTGANKAEYLAEGIYKALITTFAGLAVAIPAAILAHHYEGRIQKLLHQLEEALLNLLPYLDRFEGRMRVTKEDLERPAPRSGKGTSGENDPEHTGRSPVPTGGPPWQ